MNRKSTLSFIIALCLAFSMATPLAGFAEGPKQQKEGIFTYIVENGAVTITNVDDTQKTVIVPSSFDDVPVTTLAGGAFGGSVKIEEVILPDTITSINSMCFSYCTELIKVVLPAKLTKLENGVFNHCTKLRTIKLPESLEVIEKDAFYRCDELWTITIPDGVTFIGENAFAACPNLSAATIPESVISIGENAFQKNGAFRIYAKPSSKGESYALENKIPFEELITVSINSVDIVFDQPPITDTENHRTLVPMRAVLSELNAKITWESTTDSSIVSLPNHLLAIRVGETFMMVNGEKQDLSTPAIEYNWRTLVPIRDVIEALGGKVQWNEEEKHISIKTDISLVH